MPVLNCELLDGPEPHADRVLSFHSPVFKPSPENESSASNLQRELGRVKFSPSRRDDASPAGEKKKKKPFESLNTHPSALFRSSFSSGRTLLPCGSGEGGDDK